MHIVFLSGEYPLWTSGGVGTFIQTLGRKLVKQGHLVTVVGMGKETKDVYLEDDGVAIYRLRKNTTRLPNFMMNSYLVNKKLKQLQKQQPIDIIESAEGGLALLSSKHVAKKVIRLHGGHHFFAEAEKRGINWRKGWLEKRSFSKADGFIAISNYVRTHTATYLSYHQKPVTTIPLPLNTSIEIPKVPIDNNRILFAGTVCEKKGVRQLLEAFDIVRERYPNKQLDLYGREWFFPNGDSYEQLLRSTYKTEFFKNVHFHGAVSRDELDQKYMAAAFCVFPSLMETQGLVSIEAMLLEKPVLFSSYGPGSETVEHEKTGLLCDVYEPKDIADKMIWFIENPEAASAFGKRARSVVIEKYDAAKVMEQNVSFYKQLLAT